MPSKPRPPTDLGARGRRFWQATMRTYDLSGPEQELLAEVCRLLDELDALQAVVDADGLTVTGSTGQVRVHPALNELRQHRLAVGRLLGQLELPDEDEQSVPSPASLRAAKAARARWARRDAVAQERGSSGTPSA